MLLKRLKDRPITLHSAAWENISLTIIRLNGTHGAAAQLPTFYPSRSIWAINDEEIALAEKEQREPVLMEHFSPHCLRHSFATRAFEAGLPPKTVQTIMGHSSTAMTLDLYTHTTERKKREDIDKLAGVFTA